MSVETDVYDALVGDDTFNVLVGGDTEVVSRTNGRVYPEPLPDDVEFPCAAYSLVTDVPMASRSTNTVNSFRVQVTLCATSYSTTRDMRDAIQDIIDGNSSWQKINIGPDMFDDEGGYRYLPVDIRIIGV